MNETKATRIAAVRPASDYTLRIRWTSGAKYTVDVRELLFRLKGLSALRDPAVFAKAKVGEGGHSVIWPDDLGMGADRLWELSLEQNGRADAAEFLRWRWRHGLSLSGAADALGVSRRMVAYYASAEREVPRTVLLACKGWEAEHRQAA
ncbi:MAG: DUF2442 domain-containing protein [Xanthomonadales bacterium]|nr:DUF2442 domain-containing protein [Xanthomonadales bacterium]